MKTIVETGWRWSTAGRVDARRPDKSRVEKRGSGSRCTSRAEVRELVVRAIAADERRGRRELVVRALVAQTKDEGAEATSFDAGSFGQPLLLACAEFVRRPSPGM